MAYQNTSAHRAQKSSQGRILVVAAGTLLSCVVIAGAGWGLATTLHAMDKMAQAVSQHNLRLAAPLPVKVAVTTERRLPPVEIADKSSRIVKPSQDELRRRSLTVAAIRMAHQRNLEAERVVAEAKVKAEKARIAVAQAETVAATVAKRDGSSEAKPSLVTALVEDVPVRDMQPFGLVLAKPDTDDEVALPNQVPLPIARPLIETVATSRKPAEDETATRSRRDRQDEAEDAARAKPERSLFGDLFKNKLDSTAWPGKGTKVAIYDVSNATVYMPDGTKLRAHSGIGHMRDNPRYEHVTMRGPTPAGIYRLKMREKRFHGVEAIRMTSIDGRDPKNRTGLLTHTNLLRGQKGSHGCVAFQNYEPFLRAFKRGKVTMLVVVPEMPSSRTQLAALYRKAGA